MRRGCLWQDGEQQLFWFTQSSNPISYQKRRAGKNVARYADDGSLVITATACSVNDRQLFRTTMVENDEVPLLLQYVHQGHRRHRREHDCRHRHLPPLPPYLTFAAAQRAMCTFPAVAASKNKKPKLAEPIPLGARGQKTPFPKLSETFIAAPGDHPGPPRDHLASPNCMGHHLGTIQGQNNGKKAAPIASPASWAPSMDARGSGTP